MPKVVLTLIFDMGDYDEPVSKKPEDWEESFYQSDANIDDMTIIGVDVMEGGDA